jgi:cytochrome P450
MDEIYEAKKTQVQFGATQEGMDIFDALIRGSGITKKEGSTITKSDLLGNAFVIMLAGHETTANTLHFSLIYELGVSKAVTGRHRQHIRWQAHERMEV